MFSTSSSSVSLFRTDSGFDLHEDGVHGTCYKEGGNEMSSASSNDPDPTPSTSGISSMDSNEEEVTTRTWRQKLWPPRGPTAKWITWLLVMCGLYGSAWSLFPEHMAPYEEGVHTGKTFGLILTLMLCFTAEILFVKIPTPKNYPPLPPLLASLLTGLALKNLPAPANIAAHIDEDVSRTLRELALTVILTRAGLEIDPEGMAKVKWAVIRLAFMPCLAETVTIGITANLILGFPFLWSFMMGFMIAAVSPAVVIPSLIILQDKGLGVAKGVPSLVMAASGIDDVLAIAGFTVLLGLAIPTGLEEEIESFISKTFGSATTYDVTTVAYDVTTSFNNSFANVTNATHHSGGNAGSEIGKEIGGAIIEIIIGIISGLVLGMLISYIPSRKMRYRHFCRGFLLLTIGIVFVFGTELWGIPGAGALCALVTSFTASLQWKEETKPLEKSWHFMWTVFQPILFGLTGTLVDVGMMDGTTIGLGLAVLGCAMVGRLLMSTSVTFGLKLNLKERLFVSVAWIPKGTVQAALGSTAYDQAMRLNRPDIEIYWGQQILVIAVLATLITAPVGAFGIAIAGPKLLTVGDVPHPHDNEAYVGDDDVSSEGGGGKEGKMEDDHEDDGYPATDTESTDVDHPHHYIQCPHHSSHHGPMHRHLHHCSQPGCLGRRHSGIELRLGDHDLDKIKEEDDDAIPDNDVTPSDDVEPSRSDATNKRKDIASDHNTTHI